MARLGVILALSLAAVPPQSAKAADIGQRTAIVCVSQQSKSLISIPPYAGSTRKDKLVSTFTQWMFEAEKKQARPLKIRFLWIPHTQSTPAELKIATTDSRHGIIRLLSQTRYGVLAATSASLGETNVGWMFAINFKAEQVIATSVYSNFGGARGQAFNYSCRFDNETPQGKPPGADGGVG
jgi:hypothetical protein